jgi:arylformamidase
MIELSRYKIHDLTHTLSEKTIGYSVSTAKTVEQDGWNAQWLRIYSHAGTHMDAPFHFAVNDKTIDNYEPAALMGKAWIARVKISQNRQLIGVADMGSITSKLSAGDSLLIQTGWSRKIDLPDYRDDLPRISKELARWCVEKKVKILGVESPSVADVNNLPEVTEIHRILLGGDVIIVEGLRNLASIKKESIFLIALPLKIFKGDGAPARVIAFEKNEAG